MFARKYNFDITEAVKESCKINEIDEATQNKILDFIKDRLYQQLNKDRGFDANLVNLAINIAGNIPYQALNFIETMNAVKNQEWFTALTSSALRVKNILRKNEKEISNAAVNPDLMILGAEKNLYEEISRLNAPVKKSLEVFDWEGLAKMLAELSPVVAKFFDDVMVMDKDEKIRANRIALLDQCNKLFAMVGDLSTL